METSPSFMKKLIFIFWALVLAFNIQAQTRRALLVGISSYDVQKTNWTPIHGANDVALLNKALVGFKIKTLVNSDATYSNIIKELKALTNQTKAGDVVYLHFSGHGQPYEDIDGDEDDGWDEAFIPYDAHMSYKRGVYEGKNHLTDDILHNYLEELRKKAGTSGIVYVSIDACHSGESYRGDDFEDEEGIFIEDSYIESLNTIPEEIDEEDYERGSSCGFTMNNKIYAVSRSSAKIHGRIQQTPGLSKIIMLEACLSTQKSKELKLSVKGSDGKKSNFYCGPLTYSIYKVLTQSNEKLTTQSKWIASVRSTFNKVLQSDNLQQLVIETSE